jgi:hypothetical protein
VRGDLSAKEVGGKSRAESVRTRRNQWKKGNKKRLNKERRAQKPHKDTWTRSGKAQEGRKKYYEREATEGKKRQRGRGCGNIEKAAMAEAHCCFYVLYNRLIAPEKGRLT